MSSILNDVKHQLGLLPENTDFDQTLIIHINTVFSILTQLGVGVTTGFQITGATDEWADFYEDQRLNSVQSYVYVKVRYLFDPPKVGGHIAAIERQITELEYRLHVEVNY